MCRNQFKRLLVKGVIIVVVNSGNSLKLNFEKLEKMLYTTRNTNNHPYELVKLFGIYIDDRLNRCNNRLGPLHV